MILVISTGNKHVNGWATVTAMRRKGRHSPLSSYSGNLRYAQQHPGAIEEDY